MTHNQIEFYKAKETARSNRANESETQRHNTATEAVGFGGLRENARHNLAQEGINWYSNYETNRANQARELENSRSNVAKEQETHRHNVQEEARGSTKLANDYDVGMSNVWGNLATGLLKAGMSGLGALASGW